MKGGINLHWYRMFQTGDALGFDLQLDGTTDAGKSFETFAYLWNWNNESDYPNNAPWKECLNWESTPAYSTTPITKAAWDKVYEKPAPTPHTNWGDEHGEGSSTGGIESVSRWIDDMWGDDAAGSLTYAATAAVATSAFLLH